MGRVTRRAPKLACAIVLFAAVVALPAAPADAAAPVLKSVGESGGHVTATWSPALYSPTIEVATSPATEGGMYFVEANTIISQGLDDDETSFTSSQTLSPGTYYVHVSGSDESCLPCGTQFSNILSIKIGSSGSAPPVGKPGSLFTSLSVPSSQDVDKLFVRAALSTSGRLSAAGTVGVPGSAKVYEFKTVSKQAKAGAAVKLRLKLARKALAAVKAAIKRGAKVKAKLKVTARDNSGKKQTVKRTVKLKA
jgi:hypothetical protein